MLHIIATDGSGDVKVGRPQGAHSIQGLDWRAR